jgi:hypothetical protein
VKSLFSDSNSPASPASLPSILTNKGCRLGSVQTRKKLVTEFAIRPDSQSVKLAEIMCIQFKQVSQDRSVLAQGGVKLNTSGRFICVFNHSGSCCDHPQAGSRSSVEVGFVVYCSLAYSDLA